jgi:2-oxoglutarate dehydrogenase E1 component
MYDQWRKDPQSVHASWRIYFQNLEGGAATPFELPPTTGQDPVTQQLLNMLKSSGGQSTGGASNADVLYNVQQSQKLMLLIRSYMTHGHMKADLDPLKLYESYNKEYPEYADKFKLPQTGPIHLLDYKQYGFSEADLDKDFFVDIPELAGLL